MSAAFRTYRVHRYRTPTGWAVAEYGYLPSDYGDVATLTRRRYTKDRERAGVMADRWRQDRSWGRGGVTRSDLAHRQ